MQGGGTSNVVPLFAENTSKYKYRRPVRQALSHALFEEAFQRQYIRTQENNDDAERLLFRAIQAMRNEVQL